MSFNEVTTILTLIFAAGIAVGTIGLAVFAFKQIKHVNREYKKRQLYEIFEWAKSAIAWDFTEDDNARLRSSQKPWVESYLIITFHGEIVMNILRAGYIMGKVALVFNRKPLDEKIKSLMTELLNTHIYLGELRGQINFSAIQTPPNFIASLDSLKMQQSKLRQAAEDVVTEIGELIPNFYCYFYVNPLAWHYLVRTIYVMSDE